MNLAPRLGIAWSPTAKWTVRAGAGIFYVQDQGNPRFDMSRNIQGRITSTANNVTHNLTFENPFTGGSANVCGVPVPPFVCVTAPQGLANDPYRRTPYTTQYLLNFQRTLSANMVLEFGYLGSQGHRLERLISEKVKTGMYQTASEVVRHGLRLLQERDQQLRRLRADVRVGLRAAERGHYDEYNEVTTPRLAEEIKSRGGAQLAKKQARTG